MQFLMHPVRLYTLHPLFAHFTVGGTAIFVLCYLGGLRARSSAWTFAGDAVLWITTVFTLATLAFGFVSGTMPWPGGLERWKAIHLWLASGATAALVLLALVRLRARQRNGGLSPLLALFMLASAGAIAVTGWIGGEVLVFHSGMAVRAAGEGALAPPVTDRQTARNFLDAMREARAAWGGVNAELAWMLVQRPADDRWAHIEADGARMKLFAQLMAKEPEMSERSIELADDADKIVAAARKKRLTDLSLAVGEASATCARCHEEERWQ
jgi:hypothetical protein